PHERFLDGVVIHGDEARQDVKKTADGPVIKMPQASRSRILTTPAGRFTKPKLLRLPLPVPERAQADTRLGVAENHAIDLASRDAQDHENRDAAGRVDGPDSLP